MLRIAFLILMLAGIVLAGVADATAAGLEGRKAPALALKDPAGTPKTLASIAFRRKFS